MTNKILFSLIILVGCLSQVSSDIYAPSLPAIAMGLHTSISLAQKTMPIYLLGVAIAMVIYGTLADYYGRRTPLLIGSIIAIVGATVCAMATSIDTLMFGRFLLGCGTGAGAVLWRTIFRDNFSGDELAKYTSYLVTIVMFVIPAAPALGGYLQHYFGWRAAMWFIVIYAIVALVMVLTKFKDKYQKSCESQFTLQHIFKQYKTLSTHRLFISLTAGVFLTYGAVFSWFVAAPVIMIHHYGYSSVQFGWVSFLAACCGFALSGFINRRYLKRFGTATMMYFGWSMMIVSALLMFAGGHLYSYSLSVFFLVMFFLNFGAMFIWPNAFATAFTPFGHMAGYASAVYSTLQLCGGVVVGFIVSHFALSNVTDFGYVLLILPVAAMLLLTSCAKLI